MTERADESYDLILAGTSFATSFFLLRYLQRAKASARILVLEKFPLRTHRWQLENREIFDNSSQDHFINLTDQKTWIFGPAFGGGSNCWWACTPRLMPSDFRLKSLYGIGRDWPVSYEELEPYYCEVEELMSVSGADDGSPYPRSRPLPHPPHRLSNPEELLKAAFPGQFFQIPCARSPRGSLRRPGCCSSGVCRHCPVDAKFTILNELQHLYHDPRVTLKLESPLTQILTSASSATGVIYETSGKEQRANAELVVLGANALFNPYLLLKSGFSHPQLGRRLHEQMGVSAVLDLAGVDNFQGSASLSGHGYMFYDGEHRRERGAAIIETSNIPENLRFEPQRWRQRLQLKFVIEDLPSEKSLVRISPHEPSKPEVYFDGFSEYAQKTAALVPRFLEQLGRAIPIEKIVSIET
jgi:choline dehydrogenase-like flavoprotein